MMDDSNDFYLVVDLEATCCDRQTIPRHHRETIEIGAVLVNSQTLAPVVEFQTFIRPVRHPQLTNFCTALTTITQADVDAAMPFSDGIAALQQWLSPYLRFTFSSLGEYDRRQLQQDCDFHHVTYPFGQAHLNLKQQFTATQNLSQKYGMAPALKLAKLSLDGTHHRGIDDAKNLVKLLPYIMGSKTL